MGVGGEVDRHRGSTRAAEEAFLGRRAARAPYSAACAASAASRFSTKSYCTRYHGSAISSPFGARPGGCFLKSTISGYFTP
jgi:hypothetical protein